MKYLNNTQPTDGADRDSRAQVEIDRDCGNRGQVGIGVLIVFIAMVLVAAIAAGVLINTAGFLQTQAEQTGTESTEQVSDAINVITEVGEVSDLDKVHEVRLAVQPAAGANDINLAGLTIQFLSDDSFEELTIGNADDDTSGERAEGDTDPDTIVLTSDSGESSFVVEPITAEAEDDVVMTDGSDRYEIIIPLAITSEHWWDETETFDEGSVDDGDGNDLEPDEERALDRDDDDGDENEIVEIISIEDGDADDLQLQDDYETVRNVGDDPIDSGADIEYRTAVPDDEAQGNLNPLEEGEEAQLTITTDVGSQTVAFLQTPDSLVGPDANEVVNL